MKESTSPPSDTPTGMFTAEGFLVETAAAIFGVRNGPSPSWTIGVSMPTSRVYRLATDRTLGHGQALGDDLRVVGRDAELALV